MKLSDGIEYVESGVCKLDLKKVVRCFGKHSIISKTQRDEYWLRNQRAVVKCRISADDANWLVGRLGLVEVPCPPFRNASTFMKPCRRDRVLAENKLPDLAVEAYQYVMEISNRANLSRDERYELHKKLADLFKSNLGLMSVGTKYENSRKVRNTNYDDTRCWDCQMETSHHKAAEGEWYMVWHHVWKAAKGHEVDFLCIGCLEKRLGRQLTPADFSDVPLNSTPGYSRTKRLQDRMGINFS